MIDNKHAIAVIGCGGMGGRHAEALDEFDRVTLAGIADPDPARRKFAGERGFKFYESAGDIFADRDVDSVLIATPNHIHMELAIAAMRAGKHVICEKPVTPTSAELEKIIAVSKETGKVFYPRQNRRWDKDYLIIKRIYDQGLVGKVFNIESRVLGSRGIPGDWRGRKEFGGGMMLDWGVHLLDRLLIMVPEKVTRVFCALTNVTNKEVDDGFKLHMTYESGLTAVVEVGTCHFIKLPLWLIAGEQGTASIKDWSNEGSIFRLVSWEDRDALPIDAGEGLTKTMAPRFENSVEEVPLPDVEYDKLELYRNFVDVTEGKAAQIVTPEQALRVLRLMEAAFLSAETHSVIEFEK
ncbi:MAG: Gfo/Idh/MocA family oxidoreductase [Oscillospiraceae bacterium]|jgi:predicted dehydrogenase|nr:Gfo/Idh/MocA family oxidoreductase [Oscillospiraceae bacterium]